ncbi:4-hydroxy-tetrahydrodipicolinate reductase [Flavobacterium croceum]|uniref:4-hydroxy-tetrahydrodipicolinate reductase n=1 Tax=Flavobacterium croceum DSM 17960 TaxID=1121886 RepID=A0A2S4N6Q4_9FLAO|nr:4-hydroxy-tetrahydrodipicolinate reductase [Flavobacterium croceum]POS01409.1 dihydrodipicolinate reductase [Flavobacterium croceum DSM 17960]
MKIALLGYGKMGKVIEQIALQRGHSIVLKKSSTDTFLGIETADVAIDFSVPQSAVENITYCLQNNIPVVSGTTGWVDHYDTMVDLCKTKNGAFIYGSNFSLGVNLFFELNAYLAKMMSKFKDYHVSMEEIHHTQKLDKPSGTAISLAKDIIANSTKTDWSIENNNETNIYIDVKRLENVPGTHSILYQSEVDSIEITHTAHNRNGFALGAVLAAEWLFGKKGVFTMRDVLNLE